MWTTGVNPVRRCYYRSVKLCGTLCFIGALCVKKNTVNTEETQKTQRYWKNKFVLSAFHYST
jgi:hypothetical protein